MGRCVKNANCLLHQAHLNMRRDFLATATNLLRVTLSARRQQR
jgi:hypothetical protein